MWNYLRSPRSWLILLGACLLIGFAEAAQAYAGAIDRGRPMAWSRAMSATMPSWFVHLTLLPGVVAVATRFRFEPGRRGISIAVHLAACVTFGLAHLGLTSWLSDYVFFSGFPLTYWDNLKRLFTIYFISIEVGYYWAFVGVTFAVDYRKLYHERERAANELALKASRLEGSLARANLEALRMQLNPHFLFNTLNAVSVLAMKGERQTVVRILARLSDLLRMSFENGEPVVPLAEELTLLEPYLEIEQVRFKDKLQVVRRIDEDVLEAEVPTLLLQPLVENAVRHGIAQRPGPGQVEIRARRDGDRLEIIVRDTGPGFQNPNRTDGHRTASRGRAGVGLANTHARLEQLYGADYLLDTRNAGDGGAIVRIVLPFRTHAGETAFLPRSDSRTA
jgi:two-component system, LytTR family, sensor kinase